MTKPIIGWGRYRGAPGIIDTWHAVTEIEPLQSVVTACSGRWPAKHPHEYLAGRDRERDAQGHLLRKCAYCAHVAHEQRINEGLAELAQAQVEVRRRRIVSWPMTAPDYDLGGEGG